MKTRNFVSVPSYFFVTILLAFALSNCSKDDPQPVTTGKIAGKVTDLATNVALSDASVIAFDAATHTPIMTAKTNGAGDYSLDVAEGTYFMKFYKQGYESVPPMGIESVPFTVTIGQTATQPAEMSPSLISNAGYISGKVSVATTGKSGVLVVAEGNGSAYSAISDKEGNYTIFNVPAASYNVKGYLADHSSTAASVSVVENTLSNNVGVTLTAGTSGHVGGTFKVVSQTTIATPPTHMDISLVHPITKETIPGLSQSLPYSSSLSYSFSNVPDGTYSLRATYANDYIVIDPDYITKFGDYKVTVTSGTADMSSVDIVATSAVILTGPTNEMSSTVPVESTSIPTFQWTAYASTSDYVIEVTDASTGKVVWGGFTNTSGTVSKNITIPSNTTSIVYNSDGTATSELVSGKVYRWRIFASKNHVQTGAWNLIAASEDQEGLIKIQ